MISTSTGPWRITVMSKQCHRERHSSRLATVARLPLSHSNQRYVLYAPPRDSLSFEPQIPVHAGVIFTCLRSQMGSGIY